MRTRRDAGLAWYQLLVKVGKGFGEGMSDDYDRTKLICHQICNQNHSNKTRHQTQPSKRDGHNSRWYADLCLPTTWSQLKASPRLPSRWDVVWLCIHWVMQDTKQHPILIHVGGVYTTCVILNFTFLNCMQWGSSKFRCGAVWLSAPIG
jgi:hypothetical protein